MLKEYHFRVAGFVFTLSLPEEQDIDRLLPSFRPFRCEAEEGPEDGRLFDFTVVSEPLRRGESDHLLETSADDLGHTRLYATADGYRVELCFASGGAVHVLDTVADFTFAEANICWTDAYAGEALCSLLRIVYAQALPFRGGISCHAAAVAWQGKVYLFMGKSGTGKSTHAAWWIRSFPGCELLNDDNPTLRIDEAGGVTACGTPWSGKTPCYRNLCLPVGGVVRLRQAGYNRFFPREGVEAFTTLLPGCSFIRWHDEQCDCLYRLLAEAAAHFPVGELACLPDRGAATLCAVSLRAVTAPADRIS